MLTNEGYYRQKDGLAMGMMKDMMICRSEGEVTSTWHTKPTDTGLTINYHALAPQEYKRSTTCGLVHRIYRACSTWKNFHESLIKAKMILENNQYPRLSTSR